MPLGPAELHATSTLRATPLTQIKPEMIDSNMDSETLQLLEQKSRVEERRRALELKQLEAKAAAIATRLSHLGQQREAVEVEQGEKRIGCAYQD